MRLQTALVLLMYFDAIIHSKEQLFFTIWTPFTALALQEPYNLFSIFLMRLRMSIFCSELSRNSVELIHFKNASERARKGLGNGKVARLPTCEYVHKSQFKLIDCYSCQFVTCGRKDHVHPMCFVYLVQHLLRCLQRHGFPASRGAHGHDPRAHKILGNLWIRRMNKDALSSTAADSLSLCRPPLPLTTMLCRRCVFSLLQI